MDVVMVLAIKQQDKLLVQYIWSINAGDQTPLRITELFPWRRLKFIIEVISLSTQHALAQAHWINKWAFLIWIPWFFQN